MNGQIERKEEPYNIPREAERLFIEGLLNNNLICKNLPAEAQEVAKYVSFEGNNLPSVPINWRFAESISSLKALEATMVNVLLKKKYNVQPQKVTINTDHAQLFFMSLLVTTLGGEALGVGRPTTPHLRDIADKYFPSTDLHGLASSWHRASATNIYRCKDGRFFHLHGSMDPEPTLKSLGLPSDVPNTAYAREEDSYKPFEDKIAEIASEDLQKLASDEFRQAGTICWTTDEYAASEHGRANAHAGLFEIAAYPGLTPDAQKPAWWPDSASPATGPARPLAGLKVVDLTRVVAAPAVTRGLAELGASVMRVAPPHITDHSQCHVDLNWGKWNCCLDFTKEEERLKCVELVKEADVVVTGYRPGVLDKYGFSYEGLIDIVKDRERGLIVVRENSYGWNGPWSYRSGWQQISDANCGVSMEFGRAMGHDEPVTPVFPNSDYCTGVCGVIGTLEALMRRAVDGGSYKVDVALNYYSQWLVNTVGTYPPAVWADVWIRNGKPVFRHHHNMPYTIPRMLAMLHKNASDVLFRDDFFEDRESKYCGHPIRTPKPVARFAVVEDEGGRAEDRVRLGFNVSTRTNGVDQPRWPEDLMTEVVA